MGMYRSKKFKQSGDASDSRAWRLEALLPSLAVLLMSAVFPVPAFSDIQNSECFDDSVEIEITDPLTEGIGCVFFPNPFASTGNFSLTHMNDADYADLEPAYRKVKLTNLDGSGYLSGDYVRILSARGTPAKSDENVFIYPRSDSRFEQVMAYYWITEAQKYIESLGFGSTRPASSIAFPLGVKVNQHPPGNAFSNEGPMEPQIWLGSPAQGPIELSPSSGEDAEVILHEFGHTVHTYSIVENINKAVSESVFFGFEGSAHFEGIADYLSISFAEVLAGPTIDPACWAEWWVLERIDDRRCGRRLDRELHYPEILQESNSVHGVGQVFSGPLWTIRGRLGHIKTDTLVLESFLAMSGIDPSYTLADAAEVTVDAAEQLRAEGFFTDSDVMEVIEAFEDRGLL
jgi:hypothetical protein